MGISLTIACARIRPRIAHAAHAAHARRYPFATCDVEVDQVPELREWLVGSGFVDDLQRTHSESAFYTAFL